MNFTLVVAIWAILAALTLALGVYRIVFAAHNEEDVLKLGPGEGDAVQKQALVAHKLEAIDRWGKAMTVVIAVIGLGLASTYLYQAWMNPNPGPLNFYRMNSPVNHVNAFSK